MARCLVTGHKGYIGSHLFRTLREQGHEVLGIDLKEEYPKDILDYLREKADKSGFHPHYENFKPEYIFHLAAIPRVPYSIENPVEVMENNIMANSIVLNFARKVGAKRVIYSSSSSVMGNGDGPESPYAVSKLTPELECKMYSKLYGLDTVCLRYFNVYSKDQTVDGPYGTAVASFMDAIKKGTNPYITGDGEQRRDMLHVSDAVRANIFCMEYEGKFGGQHFDTGTGHNISLNEIKNIVLSKHSDVEFDYVPPRPGDVMLTKANTLPFNNLGWHTKVSIQSGIKECFNFTK
tara:strand:+ start:2105 stop:2980 length:876 start_codon:yes stop_codon:yes gene_type:complete